MAAPRTIAGLATLAMLLVSACSGGNDMNQAAWDFSTPLTPVDLGSEFEIFYELEGKTDLVVTFPSGFVVEGVWDRGVRAEALTGAGEKPLPVDRVLLFETSATDLDELRASADRFLAAWGPASGAQGTIEDFMSRTADINEREGTPIGQTYPVGRNVAAFTGDEQDGITPTWGVRFTGDIVTIRVTLAFEPAKN